MSPAKPHKRTVIPMHFAGVPGCKQWGRAGHRKGLVVEVAPNVVDASAVVLSSSPHVITDVELDCDASVPVFDPLESNDEDELDAISRNVTGVPGVGVSYLQGSTQVDDNLHEEPMGTQHWRTGDGGDRGNSSHHS